MRLSPSHVSLILGALAALALPLVTGCAAKKDVAAGPTSPVAAQAKAAPAVPQGDASIDTQGLHISDAIARACGLPRTESAAQFEFDSSTIGNEDRAILASIAKCLSEGALRGKTLALVGRADPRGEDEYNMSLGEARADSVRRYLHDLGVAAERVAATSRGELDSMGTDEPSWAKDRRVDIELASR